jgi:hypothetical protein
MKKAWCALVFSLFFFSNVVWAGPTTPRFLEWKEANGELVRLELDSYRGSHGTYAGVFRISLKNAGLDPTTSVHAKVRVLEQGRSEFQDFAFVTLLYDAENDLHTGEHRQAILVLREEGVTGGVTSPQYQIAIVAVPRVSGCARAIVDYALLDFSTLQP